MATFSSGVKCFRSFLIRSLRYLNGRTLSPFPAEAGHHDYLRLREELVTTELQHDLDNLGIAKNAREEKTRARDAKAAANSPSFGSAQDRPLAKDARNGAPEARGPQKNDEAYNARMASLYREVVLKEKPVQSQDGFTPLGALAKPNGGIAPAPEKTEAPEPVAGD